MTKKAEWLAGTRSAVPIMLGYVPVGIAYGVMARQAGLNTWQTVLMSLTVFVSTTTRWYRQAPARDVTRKKTITRRA